MYEHTDTPPTPNEACVSFRIIIIRMILQTIHIESFVEQILFHAMMLVVIYTIRLLCNIILNNKLKAIAILWLVTNVIMASDRDYWALFPITEDN